MRGYRMKQISARAFRVLFPKLTEPVTVSTRGEGGEIRMLGVWDPWPLVEGRPATDEDFARARAIVEPGFGASRPAPKPRR